MTRGIQLSSLKEEELLTLLLNRCFYANGEIPWEICSKRIGMYRN